MNATKAALMITTFFSMSQGLNHYTLSSTKTYLKNLSKFHEIEIQRSWFYESFRWLDDNGYVNRQKRYQQKDNGLISQIPSMITFTLKGVAWLVSMGVGGARKIYNSMMKYLKKQDNRWPSRSQFDDGSYKPEDPGERERLNALLGNVTKELE